MQGTPCTHVPVLLYIHHTIKIDLNIPNRMPGHCSSYTNAFVPMLFILADHMELTTGYDIKAVCKMNLVK